MHKQKIKSSFQGNVLNILSLSSSSNSNFNEQEWVKQIQKTLNTKDLEDDQSEIRVTIFTVPKTLMQNDRGSYIPQQVAIGPYHYLRPELHDMERYKIAAAKRNQKELQTDLKLQDLVEQLIELELKIRTSYHRPLSFGGQTLAWMMAIDASFLLEFLQVCAVKKGNVNELDKIFPSRVLSQHLIDLSRNETSHNAILRDIMMVENQIPMFVMRKFMGFQFSSQDLGDEMLITMLIGVCKEISPFKMEGRFLNHIEIKECAHFLDFLCRFIVPSKGNNSSEIIEISQEEEGEKEKGNGRGEKEKGNGKGENEDEDELAKPSYLSQLCDEVWQILSQLEEKPVEWIKGIISSKPVKFALQLPGQIVSNLPVLKVFKAPLENLFNVFENHKGKKEDDEDPTPENNFENPPLLEEITIPSVTELCEVGVQFLPTNEGITSISFDKKTLTFYIPTIDLDVNSEIILRNLVAYEACNGSGPLFLTRYAELLNGIIDKDADAKILCQKGIIINHLKSDEEVANLWNDMSKSIRLTKVHDLDKVIKEVNKFYNGKWKVKFGKFMKENVFGSWRILTFLAAVVLLLLMGLQAFCQVYSCGRILPIKPLQPVGKSV